MNLDESWHTKDMKHTLIFETTIECDAKKLFDFHADTNNLPLITPQDTEVEIIALQTPLEQGNEATLKITKHTISFIWKLTFEIVDSPHLIVDVASRSPFKMFRHEHHFVAIDEKHSILRDKITFSLPLWPLSMIAVPLVKRDMKKMFKFRHAQTKAYLSKQSI
ncbi:MAG: hypothetical protein U9O64_02330 [Campylobacterota bacterium]|nr:hypothetical protein [Campylobacterota bacterium]